MDNATRWIICLVMAALLLYSCALFRSTRLRLYAAGEELSALRETELALREENEALERRIAMAAAERHPG